MAGYVETMTFEQLGDRLASLGRRISFRQPLQVIRQLIASKEKENFTGSHGPDGEPWKPLKASSRRRKRDKRGRAAGGTPQPLRDSGALMASVTGKGAGHVETLTDVRLEYGTNLAYAGYQQDGTPTIPARPFIGIGDPLAQQIEQIITEHAARAVVEGL